MLLLNLPPSCKKKLRHRETKLVFAQLLSGNVCVKVTQSCPTLCNPMDYSLPHSSVHRILQARILEWVAIPFSRGSSRPRDWSHVSCVSALQADSLPSETPGKSQTQTWILAPGPCYWPLHFPDSMLLQLDPMISECDWRVLHANGSMNSH